MADSKTTKEVLPSADTLQQVAKFTVLDREGKEIPFEDVYSSTQRTLVVFVRHFFCGSCQEYLRSMLESITPDYLAHLPVPTSIAIVGCGDPALIDHYATETGCPYPMYSNPTATLYNAFGMDHTWEVGQHPEYIRMSFARIVFGSIWQMLKQLRGGLFLRGGSKTQVGGECLYEGKEMAWCHRMTTTWDHTEIADLRAILDGTALRSS